MDLPNLYNLREEVVNSMAFPLYSTRALSYNHTIKMYSMYNNCPSNHWHLMALLSYNNTRGLCSVARPP